jgi:hypothetical protein
MNDTDMKKIQKGICKNRGTVARLHAKYGGTFEKERARYNEPYILASKIETLAAEASAAAEEAMDVATQGAKTLDDHARAATAALNTARKAVEEADNARAELGHGPTQLKNWIDAIQAKHTTREQVQAELPGLVKSWDQWRALFKGALERGTLAFAKVKKIPEDVRDADALRPIVADLTKLEKQLMDCKREVLQEHTYNLQEHMKELAKIH